MTSYPQQHYESFPKSTSFKRGNRIEANRPGEIMAIKNGCTCYPGMNNEGFGTKIGCDKHFLITELCPIHDITGKNKILVNIKSK